jgi:excisionase family DNA binding protein
MTEDYRLLSTAEAAERLKVSSATVERLVHAGELRVVELGTSRRQKWRIRPDDLMAFIEARTVKV